MQKSVAVIVPCYKRPEYTEKCIRSLEESQDYENAHFYLFDDGSQDTTESILRSSSLPKTVIVHPDSYGLRNTIIEFFGMTKDKGYDFLAKIDNDIKVPLNWLNNMLDVFSKNDVDILSPNVYPSNAAYQYGSHDPDLSYMPSKTIGGLWFMKNNIPRDIYFESHDITGIKGAWHLLNQIVIEKDPKIGWAHEITVQDVGHWSGNHPEHLKTQEHAEYSAEVGRATTWA